MKIIDKYIFFEWLKAFLGALGLTLGILILHIMYDNLGNLIEYDATFIQILLFYGLFLPSLVPLILPISLLISVIFVLGNLHKNNEIVAMRAAGMNAFRITRPLWLVGVLLSAMLFWLNADLVPSALESSNKLFNNLKYQHQIAKSKSTDTIIGNYSLLCFNNRNDKRIWFINKFSEASKKAYGVEVHRLNSKGLASSKILAQEGFFDDLENHWVFIKGQEIFFDEQTNNAIKNETFQRKVYPEFKEDPTIMRLSMTLPKDLSLKEAKALIVASGKTDTTVLLPYQVKIASTWASSFACLIVVAIGIPFSISGVRTNPVVGVSKTAGIFFAYYLLDSIFTSLGGSGALPVNVAVWIPNVAMLFFAIFLYRKVI